MGTLLGALTLGYECSASSIGYSVLIALSAAAPFVGLWSSPSATPAAAEATAGPRGRLRSPPPAPLSCWPTMAAFGPGSCRARCRHGGPAGDFLGEIVIRRRPHRMMVRAWSERATGDPRSTRRSATGSCTRSRSILAVVVIVGALRPLHLARPHRPPVGLEGYVVFGLVPAVILLVGWLLITARPNLNPNLVAAFFVVGAMLAVLAGGVSRPCQGSPRDRGAPRGGAARRQHRCPRPLTGCGRAPRSTADDPDLTLPRRKA